MHHQHHQPFNNEEVDIGIGRVTPPNEQSDYLGPDDFRCLRRLTRRRSSPLRQLLQDVDYCLISYLEALEAPHLDDQQRAMLKTEGIAD